LQIERSAFTTIGDMMKKSLVPLIFILIFLIGCQGDVVPVLVDDGAGEDGGESPQGVDSVSGSAVEAGQAVEETAVSNPTDIPPTLTPPPPPEPENSTNTAPVVDTAPEPDATQPGSATVTIEAADGLAMIGTYAYPGGIAPYPGVILLHMLGSDRGVWQSYGFMGTMLQNGYAVLAVDMRGHGDTGGTADWELARDDLQRVYQFFIDQPEVDGEQTAVIGASIGANMALVTAVNQPEINTVILLSPGLDYRGVTTEDQIVEYGRRPIMIVASEEDSQSASASQQLHDSAAGDKAITLYNGAGHGTTMFANEAALPGLILDWLRQHVSP
jgi:dienelactone hydrolase